MFGRKVKNEAAALPIQEPVQQTIHNHAPNPAWDKVANVATGLLLAWVAWLVLCYFLDQLGSDNPERDGAGFVLFGGVGLFMLWLASKFLVAIIDKGGSLYKEINQARLDANVHIAQITAGGSNSAATSNRAIYPDAKKAEAATKAMQAAYQFFREKKRLYKRNEKRPWGRNAVRGYNIDGLRYDEADTLKDWLTVNGFITADDNINLYRYPQEGDAVRALNLFIAPPIVFSGNRPTEYQERTSLIEGVK